MTPILSDLEAHVTELQARYQCPLQFYEARAYLMGAVACPEINANSDQALRAIWENQLPKFLSVDDADYFFDVIAKQFWNSLIQHQEASNPFYLVKYKYEPALKHLSELLDIRCDEISSFIDGISGPDYEANLCDKAIACVDALDDNLDLLSELSCAIIDQEVKKQEDRYHDLLAELEYLVAASEREINKAINAAIKRHEA